MVTIPFPQNLSLLRPQAGREPLSIPAVRVLRPRVRVVSRRELLERAESIGNLAPDASLSFVAVRLRLAGAEPHAPLDAATEAAIGSHILRMTRPTDTVGRLGPRAYGIVLQGTGQVAAAAVAARLAHHLNQLVAARLSGVVADVYTATGTGVNAKMLPVAAAECDYGHCS